MTQLVVWQLLMGRQAQGAVWITCSSFRGFPGGSEVKKSTCNARDAGLMPGSGRFPGGGHGNLLRYFCWENPMDKGVWWAVVHGVTKSQT